MSYIMLRLLCTLLTVSSLAFAQTQHNQLSEQEKLAGWQLLFDGASTAGWEGFNDTPFPSQSWAIEDDALRTLSDSGGGDLVSVSQFENFELVFDWKLVPGGNSGVKYLVQKAWAGPGYRPFQTAAAKQRSLLHATGPEYQLLDDTTLNRNRDGWEFSSCGSLYLLYKPGDNKVVHPPGSWNNSRILVRGTHAEHWLNGEKIVEYEFNSQELLERIEMTKFKQVPGFGFKGPGHIALTHHNHPSWYRNIKIRSIEGPSVYHYLPGRMFDPEGLIPRPRRFLEQPGDPTTPRTRSSR